MSVVRAQIQTVEEIYRLVWNAVASKHSIEAANRGRSRLFCPHRLDRNREGQFRVLCYQYGGDSQSGLQPVGSPANWRCVALEKRRIIRALSSAWLKPTLTLRMSPSAIHKKDIEKVCPSSCRASIILGVVNGIRIMPLGANGATNRR
jgi:hypothetical protein